MRKILSLLLAIAMLTTMMFSGLAEGEVFSPEPNQNIGASETPQPVAEATPEPRPTQTETVPEISVATEGNTSSPLETPVEADNTTPPPSEGPTEEAMELFTEGPVEMPTDEPMETEEALAMTVDYSKPVSENEFFQSGYVLMDLPQDEPVYSTRSKRQDALFSVQFKAVIYMESKDQQTGMALVSVGTDQGVMTGWVRQEAIRPMADEEVQSYLQKVKEQPNILIHSSDILLMVVAVWPPLQETEEPARELSDETPLALEPVNLGTGYVSLVGDLVVHLPDKMEHANLPEGGEARYRVATVPKGSVLYMLASADTSDETPEAQMAVGTTFGLLEQIILQSNIRLLSAEEVLIYQENLAGQELVYFINDDPALPLGVVQLAEKQLDAFLAENLRAEPLWEGGIPERIGDMALLGRSNSEGVSLEAFLSESFANRIAVIDVTAYDLTAEALQSALQALFDKDYGLFYVSGTITLETAEGKVITYQPTYRYTREETAWHIQTLADGAQNLAEQARAALAPIPFDLTEAEQAMLPPIHPAATILAVHDTLCGVYSFASNSSADGYALFENNIASSMGIAQAFKATMEALGFPCVVVRSSDMSAAWNMVQVEGRWYHVVMHRDMQASADDNISRGFLLASDEQLKKSGFIDWEALYVAADRQYDDFDWMGEQVFQAEMDLLKDGGLPSPVQQEQASVMASFVQVASLESTLAAGIESEAYRIDVSSYYLTASAFILKFQDFMNYNPQYFYVNRSFSYGLNIYGYVTAVYPEYIYTGAQRVSAVNAFNAYTNQIINAMPAGLTALEKALFVNDWFAINFEYDTSYSIYRPDQLFNEKRGVCQAYALAFMHIMNVVGVSVEYVISDDMNHAWNLVYVGGSWYHVDTTWNDPVSNKEGRARHYYFMQSDSSFTATRRHYGWEAKYTAPNTKYDSYFWEAVDRPFTYLNGYWYFSQNLQILKWDGLNNYTVSIYSFPDSWKGWWPETGVVAHNGKLLYNLDDRICSISPNGTNNTLVYKPLLDSGYEIYNLYKKNVSIYYYTDTVDYYSDPETYVLSAMDIGGDTPQDSLLIDFIKRMYLYTLGRQPDVGGFNTWYENLKNGTLSGAQISCSFILSQEFQGRNLSNSEFLDVLYHVCMNRGADAGGKATWLEAMDDGVSRIGILNQFINSPEYTNVCTSYGIVKGSIDVGSADQNPRVTMFVFRLYTICLGRAPDSKGLNDWCRSLLSEGNSGSNVARGFVVSPEFQGRPLTDAQYVSIMYNALLGRTADAQGLSDWVKEIQKYGRAIVFEGFIASPEWRSLMASYGIN